MSSCAIVPSSSSSACCSLDLLQFVWLPWKLQTESSLASAEENKLYSQSLVYVYFSAIQDVCVWPSLMLENAADFRSVCSAALAGHSLQSHFSAGLSYPRCKALHFPVLSFMRFLLDHFSSLLRASEWQPWFAACPPLCTPLVPQSGIYHWLPRDTIFPFILVVNGIEPGQIWTADKNLLRLAV